MSIEYHKIVKHFNDKNNFQIFVFRYDRIPEEKQIALLDMWCISVLNGVKSRIRIDLDGLAEAVYFHPTEKMSDSEVQSLYKEFDDVIDDEVKIQRELELLEVSVGESLTEEAEKLISAADMAMEAHPIDLSIDEIVKNIQLQKNETQNRSHNKS